MRKEIVTDRQLKGWRVSLISPAKEHIEVQNIYVNSVIRFSHRLKCKSPHDLVLFACYKADIRLNGKLYELIVVSY